MDHRIAKLLSANDTGETGGHQSGILVPRDDKVISFFPCLDLHTRNPRCHIRFLDDLGTFWELAFIYYNNQFFGGTRNEYRLTRTTKFIRQAGLVQGDELVLSRKDGRYMISYRRKRAAPSLTNGVLKLGIGWRVVNIE